MTIQSKQSAPPPVNTINFVGFGEELEQTELYADAFKPDIRTGLGKYFGGTISPLEFTEAKGDRAFAGTGSTIIPWEFRGTHKPAENLPDSEVPMVFNGVAVPPRHQTVHFAGVHIIQNDPEERLIVRLVDEAKLMDQLGVVSNTRAVVDVPPPPEATNAAT